MMQTNHQTSFQFGMKLIDLEGIQELTHDSPETFAQPLPVFISRAGLSATFIGHRHEAFFPRYVQGSRFRSYLVYNRKQSMLRYGARVRHSSLGWVSFC